MPGRSSRAISLWSLFLRSVLKEALGICADKVFLISGRQFGGSDTLATSYIIASTIKQIEAQNGKFDLIFAGKQAIDGDTGQVGPEIAAHMGIPQITYASEATVEGDEIVCKRESDKGYDFISVKMPAVITVVKTPFEPRYPTIKTKMAARKKPITTLGFADIEGIDETRCGLKGSPTKVRKTFTPDRTKTCVKLEEEDVAAEVAQQLRLPQL